MLILLILAVASLVAIAALLLLLTVHPHVPTTVLSKFRSHIYLSTTFHTRLAPTRHKFSYPVIYLSLDLDELSRLAQSWWFGYNRWRLLSVWDKDYLGGARGGIKEKVLWHLEQHNVPTAGITRIQLVTMPRLLGYAFNPVSMYYCYSSELAAIVLEVNNTFGEKHIYVLDPRQQIQKHRAGYQYAFKFARKFHVSPFNDRTGSYACYVSDPAHPDGFNLRLVVHEEQTTLAPHSGAPLSENKKFMAQVRAHEVLPLTSNAVLKLLMRYPVDIFLTFPRILREAAILAYRKHLPVYPRPEPVIHGDTIVKQHANAVDKYCLQLVLSFLEAQRLDRTFLLHPPDPFAPPFKIGSGPPLDLWLKSYALVREVVFRDVGWGLVMSWGEGTWECEEPEVVFSAFLKGVKSSQTSGWLQAMALKCRRLLVTTGDGNPFLKQETSNELCAYTDLINTCGSLPPRRILALPSPRPPYSHFLDPYATNRWHHASILLCGTLSHLLEKFFFALLANFASGRSPFESEKRILGWIRRILEQERGRGEKWWIIERLTSDGPFITNPCVEVEKEYAGIEEKPSTWEEMAQARTRVALLAFVKGLRTNL
ncbi:uncharacterized protein VTP21DRAFT_11294 [Calcarisporiella thermophila]|uniref:uncharacterized protein n=1 Tax=Calcarisporiella thermophila TaxID=911321 RepID=UPI0037449670